MTETAWHAEVFRRPENMGDWHFAGGGFVWPEQFVAKEAMKLGYGPLFAYMFRRFGPSEWGSDDLKEIACWNLTTPNPDVVLAVSPSPFGAMHSFGFGVRVTRYDNRRDLQQKMEVIEALRAAVGDLLWPVDVRDARINACGVMEDDVEPESLPYFEYAGYGVDHKWLEKLAREGD